MGQLDEKYPPEPIRRAMGSVPKIELLHVQTWSEPQERDDTSWFGLHRNVTPLEGGNAMLQWIQEGADRVEQIAKTDREFQKLVTRLNQVEQAHTAVLETLSEQDRETILEYEDLITELEYQKTRIAYYLGKKSQ